MMRIILQRCVAVATLLPIPVNAVLLLLLQHGKLGTCDGVWTVGISFMISAVLLMAALAGTGFMMAKRKGELLWVLIVVAIIQTTCLAFVIAPFLGLL